MYLFDLGLADQQPIRLVLQPVLCPAPQLYKIKNNVNYFEWQKSFDVEESFPAKIRIWVEMITRAKADLTKRAFDNNLKKNVDNSNSIRQICHVK